MICSLDQRTEEAECVYHSGSLCRVLFWTPQSLKTNPLYKDPQTLSSMLFCLFTPQKLLAIMPCKGYGLTLPKSSSVNHQLTDTGP